MRNTQDGIASPNPSYPSEVKTVTGENTIDVVGRNLFDGEIELGNLNPADGTASASDTRTRSKNFTKVKPNTTYTFTRTTGQYRWIVGYTSSKVGITDGNFDSQASALLKINSGTNSGTFTTSATTEYIKWYDTSSTDTNENVQLEKGLTATTYEPYKSQSYPISLTGKNLFDKNSPNILNAYLNADGTTSANITFRVSDYINVSDLSDITISGNNGNSELCCFYDENKTFISSFGMGTLTTRTVSVPNNVKYLRVTLNSSVLNQYQIEKGSTATPYEEFWQIELAKIEDYKDYIYRNATDGKWYKHKELQKYIFNGAENWGSQSFGVNSWATESIINTNYNTSKRQIISNIFKGVSNDNRASSGDNVIYTYSNIGFYIRNTTLTTLAEVRSATNGNYIIYALATPTEEEITNETLISQLEAVKLLSGTQNNFTIDADTLPTLNLNYIGEASPHL